MNLPQLCIERPVMTVLVMVSILLAGVIGYRQLPVNDLPNVDFPTIQITAALPGASPETMASAVATPLERQLSTIAGGDTMSSTNFLGNTLITVTFDLERNIDAAAQDIQAAISQAARQLPQNLPSPPAYQKVNPADQPILYLALTSPTLPLYTMDEYGETTMAQRISTVSGVAQVLVFGSQKYAVRVQVNPDTLAGRGIGIDEVGAAVAAGNVTLPTGTLQGAHQAVTIEANGQLNDAAAYRPLIVAYRHGSPVRLREIGRVIDSVENDKTAAWYVDRTGQQRSVVLAIQRQPGTNTVEVADAVKALLPTFRQQLPASVALHVLYDRSETIKDSINDVQFTLLLTLGLVVMVIFLFLRNLQATLIPSLVLPMSIVGTFAVMRVLGYSLDNLSMMALTLSVGFVVDDAIVMLENIVRHAEMGKTRLQAALDGSREIGFTIISMTLSLAAVFIPMVFLGGLVGRLFREFAVTIGAAVLVSGFVSLTLTPMLASRFLRPARAVRHGWLYRASEYVLEGMVRLYGWSLRAVLGHQALTVAVSLAVLAGTLVLYKQVPGTFLPSEDQSAIRVFTEGIEGISFDSMVAHQQALNEIVRSDPNVEAFFSTAGARGFLTGNAGILFIRTKPRDQRSLSVDEIIKELRPRLNSVPGIRASPQNPPPINPTGRITQSQYQFTLTGPDTDELFTAAVKLEARVRRLPGFIDVFSDLRIRNPKISVEINRDKASVLNVTATQVEDALYYAYSARQISTILAPNNQYQVIMELLPSYQRTRADLPLLYIRSSTGQLVPLPSVARLTSGVGPLTVNHQGQLPSVTLSFNLAPGTSLEEAVQSIRREARQIVPSTVTTAFQGTAQAYEASFQSLPLLLALAVVVIYIVLGILYESFIHPLTILTALPFAGFGALLTLWVFHVELSLYAFVGIIMLVGLVKKNGIMMVDFAVAARRDEGKTAREAIYQACLVRFRPITMTTLAALMAGLPIAMGYGAGSESRRPLGLAVVGGLVFSQTLTLYVTPVFYLLFEALRDRFAARSKTPVVD